ncbi:hypothetical protein [Chryseobacterium sp. M5A1_1a]
MKKVIIFCLAINFFNGQKRQEQYSSPPLPMEAGTWNNQITSKHVNIPNTKIYVVPFEDNYKINNGTIISNNNNYGITVIESGGTTVKNTIDDFTKESFEAKGIKVFDERFITINGVKSKILFIQGQPQVKGVVLFIDNASEKVMITAMYEANNVLLENKVTGILHSIVYNKEAKIDYLKNATFTLDPTGTKFKFHTFTTNSYTFTEDGKESSDPNILVSQIPNISNPDLKSFISELKTSLSKYGLEDIEEKNIIETKNSIQIEVYGKIKEKPSLVLYKVLKDPGKDFILFMMASSKQNLVQDLVQFKKIANTFSYK